MPEIIYKCSKCGKSFTTMPEAVCCEEAHKSVTNIISQHYDESPMGYPDRLDCEMLDGQVVSFLRATAAGAMQHKIEEKAKWYVGTLSAEGTSKWAVQLTDAEHKAVCKFLEMGTELISDSYSGSCFIGDEAYETLEDVQKVHSRWWA